MTNPISFIIFALPILFLIDFYLWKGIQFLLRARPRQVQNLAKTVFWGVAIACYLVIAAIQFIPEARETGLTRAVFFSVGFIPFFCKLLTILLLGIDDLRRLAVNLSRRLSKRTGRINTDAPQITRSEFLTKTAMVAGGGLLTTFGFGIVSGAYDYRVHRVRIPLKNLPAAFHGIKIAQLSDIHSGSFYNKVAVQGGVDMLLKEKPDLVLFTGDLVNERTREVTDYFPVFSKVKAPMGVFSVLGNHDYGDYASWTSSSAKKRNLDDMLEAHRRLGWNLMMDQNTAIRTSNEQIGLIGIQNWGNGRFSKYGNLEKALAGSEEYPVKILLSHDPSHWDAQVNGIHTDIDLALAGHTHGMQFGIDLPGFRWSPVEYEYKQWADLYQNKDQYLYVNRGYGFIGYPGRVGILPEITIFELVKA